MIDYFDTYTWPKSYGILTYAGDRVTIELKREFAKYYFSLVPKYLNYLPVGYNPHITIVRTGLEKTNGRELLKNKKLEFYYYPTIRFSDRYCWLDVRSSKIEILRKIIGLPKYRDGYRQYHCTIGYK